MRLLVLLLALPALVLLSACSEAPAPAVESPAEAVGESSEDTRLADTPDGRSERRSESASDAGVTHVCDVGEGLEDCPEGTKAIVGRVASENFAFSEDLYPEPSVVLLDISPQLRDEPEVFVDTAGQILGRTTEALFPGPGSVSIGLPIVPTADRVDLDNDGEEDIGVQVFALKLASNIVGDSYLAQMEQVDGLASYLQDVETGAITEGRLLVHAPDEAQGFPAGRGDDGIWFTEDDPSTPLPAGYTVVELGADGTVTMDRSAEVVMDTMEMAEAASPDFSDLGILESYDALLDLLKTRYAYTELRGLDWDEIRSTYRPRVAEADAADDVTAYYMAISDLAMSIGDGHVAATAYENIDALVAGLTDFHDRFGGGIGASAVAVSDQAAPEVGPSDHLVVVSVGEDTPAATAGWVPGTEIIAVDGVPTADRLKALPLQASSGTEEARLLQRSGIALSFPISQTVSIDYRLPDDPEVRTAEMVAGFYDDGTLPTDAEYELSATITKNPITYEQRGDYAIVSWNDFTGYLLPKISVLEEALAIESERDKKGMILDLRGNKGGWVTLYETMASYFFTEDDPMPVHQFDWWYYDEEAGEHVRSFMPDYRLSAPRPSLAYTGSLMILIDQGCASACEYFSQHLQGLGRATVVGQYASDGAGGFIDRAKLPGGLAFQYTVGQTTFAGTEEPNLEAKGVIPDIRVPITLETELAKARGEDPVLEAALAELDRLNPDDDFND